MKYMNEFRDGATAQRLAQEIRQITTRRGPSWRFAAARRTPLSATGSTSCCPKKSN